MKFQKTIAEALARKTRKILLKKQEEAIKNYKLSKEDQKLVEKLYKEYLELRKKEQEIASKYKETFNEPFRDYLFDFDTKEKVITRTTERIAEALYVTPKLDDLIDDFLILSIDAIDTDDLINKVTAKYVK